MADIISTSLALASQSGGEVGDFEIEITVLQGSTSGLAPVIAVDVYRKGINYIALFGQFLLVAAAPLSVLIAYKLSAPGGIAIGIAALAVGAEIRRLNRHLFRKSDKQRSLFFGPNAEHS